MDLPRDPELRWIVGTYATLRGAHESGIGTPALVQPTAAFFPDEFRGDGPSVAQMLRTMIGYAPIADDLPIELALAESPAEGTRGTDASGGCASGACGTGGGRSSGMKGAQRVGTGYRVLLDAAHLHAPDALAASLARSVGSLVLHEASEESDAARSELAAIACGFGVLLANGAAVWGKACGGLRMTQATVLSVEEITVALALFVAVHGEKVARARAHLGTTQREAFERACDWVDSNERLVAWLRDSPGTLHAATVELEPVRGLFAKWFR